MFLPTPKRQDEPLVDTARLRSKGQVPQTILRDMTRLTALVADNLDRTVGFQDETVRRVALGCFRQPLFLPGPGRLAEVAAASNVPDDEPCASPCVISTDATTATPEHNQFTHSRSPSLMRPCASLALAIAPDLP